MKGSLLSAKHFHDEAAAYEFVEARLWPNGPVCPHCGCIERISRMGGKSTRIGAYKCYNCRKPFTVKVGTIFEASHVPMRLWLQAIYLIAGSKKGFSSNQLHRTLGVTLKTAWFMSHRIRHAMGAEGLPPLGGDGDVVEVDETYIGRREARVSEHGGTSHKHAVLSFVSRKTGEARSQHIRHSYNESLLPEVKDAVKPDTRVYTDSYHSYKDLWKHFLEHESVTHSRGEYVRGDVHTNTIEGFFSIFKRGMRGIYQHCGERHLKRYLAEFDFRYTHRLRNGVDDAERADKVLSGVVGKRLAYRTATWTPGG